VRTIGTKQGYRSTGGLKADSMNMSMAVRERDRWAVVVNTLLHRTAQQLGWRAVDCRLLRTWRQFLWGVWTTQPTRLVTVTQAIAVWRQVHSIQATMAWGDLLQEARWARPFSRGLLLAVVEQLGPHAVGDLSRTDVAGARPDGVPQAPSRRRPMRALEAHHRAGTAPSPYDAVPIGRNGSAAGRDGGRCGQVGRVSAPQQTVVALGAPPGFKSSAAGLGSAQRCSG
jgi:hypothetical protein